MGDPALTTSDARSVGEQLGIDWASSQFDIEQFRAGAFWGGFSHGLAALLVENGITMEPPP